MQSDDKISHGLWPGELLKLKYITITVGYVGNMIYMYVW